MGLTISRAIVEAHGGRVAAENGPAGGVIFRVHLPADQSATTWPALARFGTIPTVLPFLLRNAELRRALEIASALGAGNDTIAPTTIPIKIDRGQNLPRKGEFDGAR